MDDLSFAAVTSMTPPPHSRRRFLKGFAGAAVAGTLGWSGAARGAGGVDSAGCGGNLGLQMVRMWSLGGFPVPPSQALPGPTWVLYAHPTVPQISFLFPPDWTAITLLDPVWAGVRLESPDRRAVIEGASAVLPVSGLTARQAADAGLQRLLTTGTVTRLCVDDLPSPGGPLFGLATSFAAVAAGSRLTAAQGMAGPFPTGGSFVLYRAMAAPAPGFTDVVEAVALPILYQISAFGQKGSDGKDGTPAPGS
jgi:hypothetical protein